MAFTANSTPMPEDERLPGDNRDDMARLVDDISHLVRMASVNATLLDRAFDLRRARDRDANAASFAFSHEWREDLIFAGEDVLDRARLIQARADRLGLGQ